MRLTAVPVERGDAGHPHLCHRDHHWQHGGPTAASCSLPTVDPRTGLPARLSGVDCAVCAGRDDLLTRPPHSHECPSCDVEWVHERRCAQGLVAWCPWDCASAGHDTGLGTRIGRHLACCPDCRGKWGHLEQCAAPLRIALPSCPGCQEKPSGRKRISRQFQPRARWAPRGRWVLAGIGGVAVIVILVSAKLLPNSSTGWLTRGRPDRVAVGPPPPVLEEAVNPGSPAASAPAAETYSPPYSERRPPLENTGNGGSSGDLDAQARVGAVTTPNDARSGGTEERPPPSGPSSDPRGLASPAPREPAALPRAVVPPPVPPPPIRPVLNLPERVATVQRPGVEPQRGDLAGPSSSALPASDPVQDRSRDPASATRDASTLTVPTPGTFPLPGPPSSPPPSSPTAPPAP